MILLFIYLMWWILFNLMWCIGCEVKVKSLCVVDFKDKVLLLLLGLWKWFLLGSGDIKYGELK